MGEEWDHFVGEPGMQIWINNLIKQKHKAPTKIQNYSCHLKLEK